MENPVLRTLFERISSDDSLRRTLLNSIQSLESDRQTMNGVEPGEDNQQANVDPIRGAQEPSTGGESSVGAQEHH